MKVPLKTIVENMSTEDLASALNENFETLNEVQHQRELMLLKKMTDVETQITSLRQEMNTKIGSVEGRITALNQEMSQRLNHLEANTKNADGRIGNIEKRITNIEGKVSIIEDGITKILKHMSGEEPILKG